MQKFVKICSVPEVFLLYMYMHLYTKKYAKICKICKHTFMCNI